MGRDDQRFLGLKRDRLPFRSRAERAQDEASMRADLQTLTSTTSGNSEVCAAPGCVSKPGSSLARPILVMSIGFVVGSIIVNWIYCRYPPEGCCADEDGADQDEERVARVNSDRRERTITGGAVGAILSLLLYLVSSCNNSGRNDGQRRPTHDIDDAVDNAGDDDGDGDYSVNQDDE
jgi:hypothetical protein